MKTIVCVDERWGIGKKNGLLFSLRTDMNFFKEKTLGHTVVMGANTLRSFPGGKPLRNRTNLVLFPGGEKREDCTVFDSLEELFSRLKTLPSDDVFIIGGAMFYKTMLPYCDTAYITKVCADGGAEVFFENLDATDGWFVESESEIMYENGLAFRFVTYKNNAVLALPATEE